MLIYISLIILAFVIGSIPSGILIGKLYGVDPRTQGSGNVGATNVKRALGTKAAVLTLLSDALKGGIAVYLPQIVAAFSEPLNIAELLAPILGLAAIFGHCLSPFLKFKGGKGVATSLGAFLTLSPWPTLICVLFFIVLYKWKKYVSLASISSAVLLPILLAFGVLTEANPATTLSAALAAMLIVLRHRENIDRLSQGKELRSP